MKNRWETNAAVGGKQTAWESLSKEAQKTAALFPYPRNEISRLEETVHKKQAAKRVFGKLEVRSCLNGRRTFYRFEGSNCNMGGRLGERAWKTRERDVEMERWILEYCLCCHTNMKEREKNRKKRSQFSG